MKIDKQIKQWAQLINEDGIDEASKSLKDQHRLERLRKNAAQEKSDRPFDFYKNREQTKHRDALDDEKWKDDDEVSLRNIRAYQSHQVPTLKKALKESSKTKFVFLSGEFGLAFREFMYAGRKFPGDDKGRIFKIDRLAKLLELQEDCVYVSSTKDDYAENAQVFIVYHSKNSNDWNLSYLDQMDIDYDKVDGYGTFEQLANKLNKHIHESTQVPDED